MGWSNSAVTWSLLRWSKWSGATTLGCEAAGVADCLYINMDGVSQLPGWKCPSLNPGETCWGHTGPQVLHSLHGKYEFVQSHNYYWLSVIILSAMLGLLTACYI